jgi:GTP-binding protein
MSRATPEVAPYPFTTINPILGCIDYRDGFQVRMADIPGLIAGASQGRGRGHDFLRHVERTKALVYVVDAAGVDYRDPVQDLNVLVEELASYGDGSLLERRALVVANKIDLLPEESIPEVLNKIEEAAREIGIQFENSVLGISAGVSGVGLGPLSKAIRDVVDKSEEDRRIEFERGE